MGHRDDWEALGRIDPLWAIHSQPQHQFGKWDVDEFFQTGEHDVAALMAQAAALALPRARDRALDFGCGVGRLTRALASRFTECVGVDISSAMIDQARVMNHSFPNCRFVLNDSDHLRMFEDAHFDLIYTRWVLQHLPNRALIKNYLGEFIRTLKPGGLLVFQLRTTLRFGARVQAGRRLYQLLRTAGVPARFLYERLKVSPMRLIAIPEPEVTEFLDRTGAILLKVERYDLSAGTGAVFFVSK